MMKKINKRGISPVVATVLLVMLGLILAIIIFLWARQFIAEQILKFGSNIENSCKDVAFEIDNIDATDSTSVKMNVVNTGNVPIYGFSIKVTTAGTIEECYVPDLSLKKDESKEYSLGECGFLTDVSHLGPVKALVLPVLLGEGEEARKAYTCPEDYGKEVDVT